MVEALSIVTEGKRKRVPKYTMAAQRVSPAYSAINSGNISLYFREAKPANIMMKVMAK